MSNHDFGNYMKMYFNALKVDRHTCKGKKWPFRNAMSPCNRHNNNRMSFAAKFSVSFYYKKRGEANIYWGLDFGNGFAAYLNGHLIIAEKSDIWWANKWHNGDVRKRPIKYNSGLNEIVTYGIELCCDGNHNMKIEKV